MEVDPLESANNATESDKGQSSADALHLGSRVAITVALLATFLALCKVKDDNLVQAMQQAQADKLDSWSFYQARNIRQEIAEASVVQLTLEADHAPAAEQSRYRDAIATYTRLAEDQKKKKEQLKQQAEDAGKLYDSLNYRDDQFDLSDALTALAISLLAVTALTHKWWLYWISLAPTALGVLMGMAGLFGWRIHSDFLAWLLS